MTTDYAKICAQLQIQRNQFADAHATAAARAETLAEELERTKVEYAADRDRLHHDLERQCVIIRDLRAKIDVLETPKPEMLPVARDDNGDDCPF